MDEVGRGTTVKDGLAIAFAALHHLATINKSRCLFATHFHELAEMVGNNNNTCGSGSFHNVRFYCSDVEDAGVRPLTSLPIYLGAEILAYIRMVISHTRIEYAQGSIATAMV